MIKDLSTTPPKDPEGYAAHRERVNGITLERLREMYVYDDSTPAAPLVRIGRAKGPKPKEGRIADEYRRVSVGNRQYLTSRLVWIYFHGPIPENMQVDHINRDKQDNRIENLRVVTRADNTRNTHVKGKSVYRGVYWNARRGKWGAELRNAEGKSVHLGLYDTEEDAATAYDMAMSLFFGSGHIHPTNASEGLISQSTVDQTPIGTIAPIRKALGVSKAAFDLHMSKIA